MKTLGHVAIHVDCLGRLDEAKRWPTFRFPVQLEVEVKAESRADALDAIAAHLGVDAHFGSIAGPKITIIGVQIQHGDGRG